MGVRLRQAVLAAAELEPVSERLRAELGLGEPYADPGVGAFGLRNAVYALGDTFLEVVSPTGPGTTAGRYLERRGDGGYMVIFQLDDLDAARERAAALGVRVVWQVDLPDISGTHLHPADTRGAIVSLDRADPPGSWRWGGPEWTGRSGAGAPGRLAGVTVAVAEPAAVAARWGELLGLDPDGQRLALDGGHVAFEEGAEDRIVAIDVELPAGVRGERESVEIGGAAFRLSAEGAVPVSAPARSGEPGASGSRPGRAR
jgi:predicted enzyme related to lactoylglutathione lyase